MNFNKKIEHLYALYLVIDGKRQKKPVAAAEDLEEIEVACKEHFWWSWDLMYYGYTSFTVAQHRVEV